MYQVPTVWGRWNRGVGTRLETYSDLLDMLRQQLRNWVSVQLRS